MHGNINQGAHGMIDYPYYANIRGGTRRWFCTWLEAAYCPGRIGPPGIEYGRKGPRPQWLTREASNG